MREIKFKVWDTQEKEFLITPKVEFVHHEKSWGNEFYLEIAEDWDSEDYDPMRYIFLQSTGLKDKNGKEIYEGDVVKLDSWNPSNMQIVFLEGAFCLANNAGEYVGDIHYIHHAGIEQAEVIGNIYENSNLLIEKKVKPILIKKIK